MDRDEVRNEAREKNAPESRRFKLRLMLLSAADAARASRRVSAAAGRLRDTGEAIRDRVSTLLRAAS
jgi:hypothetical protein